MSKSFALARAALPAPQALPARASRRQRALVAAGLFFAWLVARGVPLAIFHRALGGNDVRIYWRYANDWWGMAQIPYLQFHMEYPPGGLLVFLAPYLFGHPKEYSLFFAGEMALFDLASLSLVFLCARELYPKSRLRPLVAAGLYLATTGTLIPVLYDRFDLAASTLVLGAFYLLCKPAQEWSSALLLGLAGAVKLWPLALAPMWLFQCYRREKLRGALGGASWILLGFALPALPMLPKSGLHIFDFLRYHLERGLQIESTWSPLVFLAGQAHDSLKQIAFAHGAVELHGKLASLFAGLSTPVLFALILLPQALAIRQRLPEAKDAPAQALHVVAAVTLGFMIGGKVLSPQFLLWIIPALALLADTPLFAVGLLVTAALTTSVFPALYDPLQKEASPLRPLAVACLAARNTLLIAFYVVLLRRIARAQPERLGSPDKLRAEHSQGTPRAASTHA